MLCDNVETRDGRRTVVVGSMCNNNNIESFFHYHVYTEENQGREITSQQLLYAEDAFYPQNHVRSGMTTTFDRV